MYMSRVMNKRFISIIIIIINHEVISLALNNALESEYM